jgi:CoA:oxalate CoA-transferase
MVVQAMGGIMSITGQPGAPPTRVGTSIGDLGAGLYTAIGINAALYDRARTGEARKIDVGMLDCQINLCENAVVRYSATGEIPGPLGARHPSITPFQVFPTKEGHMIIAAGNDLMYRRLCGALERPDLAEDPRYRTNDLRNRNHDALEPELEAELKKRGTAEWLATLDELGIPASGINNIEAVLAHPQVGPRNMLVEVPDATTGTLRVAGNPIKVSGYADPPCREAAPDLDRDRAKLLAELGFGA